MLFDFLRRLDARHRAQRYLDRVDPGGIRWLREILQPGDVVVDIGAYKGGYTYWMRGEIGSEGRVYAFEPQPRLARYVRRAARAFSWDNVHVEDAALSSEPGSLTLHAPGRRPSQDASVVRAPDEGIVRSYEVRADTVDRFLAEHAPSVPVRLIKCDVEGHEFDVLRGASDVLARHRPLLLFECEARHDPTRHVTDVFEYVEGHGYRGSFFLESRRRPLEEFEVERHQVVGRLPYANNFVFEPEERAA